MVSGYSVINYSVKSLTLYTMNTTLNIFILFQPFSDWTFSNSTWLDEGTYATTQYPPIFVSDAEARFKGWESHGHDGLFSFWALGPILADLTRLTDWQMVVAVSASANHQHWVPVSYRVTPRCCPVARAGQDRTLQCNAKDILFVSFDIYILPTVPTTYQNTRKKVLIWPFSKVILINFYADENKSEKFAFQYFYPIGILWGLDFLQSVVEINFQY